MSKICEKCGNEFPFKVKVDGKTRNLCNRKFCLECSPFGLHNTSDIVCLKKEAGSEHDLECKNHGVTKFVIDKNGRRRCKACRSEAVIRRRRKVKLKLVELHGGACVICDYSRCIASLDFHHKDPATKLFNISQKGHCRKWTEVLDEANKCILVCKNCHGEIEAGLISDKEVEQIKNAIFSLDSL